MAATGRQPPSSHPALPRPATQGSANVASGLQKVWQTRSLAAWALWPLSLVYRTLVGVRRRLYGAGLLTAHHPGRPVIVVGNVIAGGAGKTPVVIAMVQHLQSRGLRAGVISRGYGRTTRDCRAATPDSPPGEVGDEPALIARSCGVPVFVAPRRLAAAQALLAAHPDTDILVCDDGLQHLALARDLEICIFNDDGVGNGLLLPAGPLREPWPRAVDWVLYTGEAPPPGTDPARAHRVQRRLASFAVRQDGSRVPLSRLQGQLLHAVAAVARPESFFAMLRAESLHIAQADALPDHYDFDSWKRLTSNDYTLICTEKDAVKLWQHHPDALAVPLQLHIDPAFFDALDVRLPALLARGR